MNVPENDDNIFTLNQMLARMNDLSMSALRKIHPAIQNHYVSEIPASHLDKVIIGESVGSIIIELGTTAQHTKVEFKQTRTGCLVNYDEEEKLMEGEVARIFAGNYLEVILRHQKKPISKLSLKFRTDNHYNFFSDLCFYLSNRTYSLAVRHLLLETTDSTHLQMILVHLRHKCLQSITLRNVKPKDRISETWDLTRVARSRQWKNCRVLIVDGVYVSVNIKKLLHFASVIISVPSICARDLISIRDAALSSKLFNTFTIDYKKIEDYAFLMEAFGPWPIKKATGDGESTQWYFGKSNKSKTAAHVSHLHDFHFSIRRIKRSETVAKKFTICS